VTAVADAVTPSTPDVETAIAADMVKRAIPIAPAIDDSAIKRSIGPLPSTPFQAGIRATMQRFAELRDAGRLDTSDLL